MLDGLYNVVVDRRVAVKVIRVVIFDLDEFELLSEVSPGAAGVELVRRLVIVLVKICCEVDVTMVSSVVVFSPVEIMLSEGVGCSNLID